MPFLVKCFDIVQAVHSAVQSHMDLMKELTFFLCCTGRDTKSNEYDD